MRITKLILFMWSFAAFADMPPVPITCQLTATPAVVHLGEPLKLSLIATGFVKEASINGEAISIPTGGIVITPTSVGDYAATGFVKATNGESSNCYTSYTVVSGTPVWEVPRIEFSACADQAFSGSLAAYAASPNGGPLAFRMASASPGWLKLGPDGTLLGAPSTLDIGTIDLKVAAVTTSGETSEAEVQITVKDCEVPSLSLTAKARAPQAFYLPSLTHVEGQYVKTSGPAWASVSLQGVVTGTPDTANVGENTFVFSVKTSGGEFKQYTVTINVLP